MANWAIAIGINFYNHTLDELKYAKRDAEEMKGWFEEVGFEEVFLFTDDSPPINRVQGYDINPPIWTQPTFGTVRRFLRKQFEDLEKESLLEAGDNFWFFFSGHGMRGSNGDYLMLCDSDPGAIEYTAISVEYVTQRLRRCGADNIVLFVDACRNDEGSKGGSGFGEQEHQGIITFYSCGAYQRSYEIEQLENGAFTYTLLKALREQEEKYNTVEKLADYLKREVPIIIQQYSKSKDNNSKGNKSRTQFPLVRIEPDSKKHLVLFGKAQDEDIEKLKNEAYKAEANKNLILARQLWVRLNQLTKGEDSEVIKGISRVSLIPNNTSLSKEENPANGSFNSEDDLIILGTPETNKLKSTPFSDPDEPDVELLKIKIRRLEKDINNFQVVWDQLSQRKRKLEKAFYNEVDVLCKDKYENDIQDSHKQINEVQEKIKNAEEQKKGLEEKLKEISFIKTTTNSTNELNDSEKKDATEKEKEFQSITSEQQKSALLLTKDINYTTELKNLLEAEKWQEADQETMRLILEIAGRQESGLLRSEDIKHFDCSKLCRINQLWLNSSNGKFGFSVQKEIWGKVGGKPGKFNSIVFDRFSDRVGWRENGHWREYKDFTFTLDAPEGHFPSLRKPGYETNWLVLWKNCFKDFLSLTEICFSNQSSNSN